MAEIKSFPNNQDVYIGAEWVMKWLHGRTSGVFGAENNLSTSVVPNSMSVEVSDGVGWLSNANGDGIVFWNDSEQSNGSKLRLTHDVADGVLDRIDRIVVTWETTNYVALPTISILKGIASSNPKPPELTNNNTQRQISLRQQRIPAGAISISSAFGTDERLNSDVCGIVTESVLVDTSVASAQFNELLQLIENNLKQIVANQIADKSVTNEKLADGAVTVQKLSKEVKEFVSADNLLDNSDFRNPVNQRGKTSYSGQGYGIDRWRSWNGENITTVNSGSVSCTKQLYQCVDPQKIKPDTRYTLAARLADGTVYCVSGQLGEKTENEKLHMEFQAETPAVWLSGGSWLWASLYEGEYTAETLPEYRPKGYGAERAECQRYFLQYNFSDVILPAKMYSGGGSADVSFFLPCTMRLTEPTVSVTASQCQLFADNSNTDCNITEAYLSTGNFVGLTAVAESNLTGSAVAVCRIMGKLTLSADL